jgi:outer membrane protein OmpA-like peptidoglycan-associated protein
LQKHHLEQEQDVDDRKTIIATSFLSAVLVLGVVVPLGFVSLQALEKKLETGQSEVQRIVIDLKTEALKEIKIATTQVADGSAKTDPAIVASLEQLKANIDELRNDQQQLFETMRNPADTVASAIPAAIPTTPPGSRDDTLNQTVLFPMGKIEGPAIDQQIATMTSEITDYGSNRKCLSNVMGFSDTLGGDKSNLELSQRRAMYVAALLGGNQIPVGDVKGWGERWLKVHTVDGIENEQNRRVVIETVCDSNELESAGAIS